MRGVSCGLSVFSCAGGSASNTPAKASSELRAQLRNTRSDPDELRGEIQCLEAGQHLLFEVPEGIVELPTLLHDLGDSAWVMARAWTSPSFSKTGNCSSVSIRRASSSSSCPRSCRICVEGAGRPRSAPSAGSTVAADRAGAPRCGQLPPRLSGVDPAAPACKSIMESNVQHGTSLRLVSSGRGGRSRRRAPRRRVPRGTRRTG